MISRGAAQEGGPKPDNTVDHRGVFASGDAGPLTTSLPSKSSLPIEGKNGTVSVKGILIDLDYALITHDINGNKIERTAVPIAPRTVRIYLICCIF